MKYSIRRFSFLGSLFENPEIKKRKRFGYYPDLRIDNPKAKKYIDNMNPEDKKVFDYLSQFIKKSRNMWYSFKDDKKHIPSMEFMLDKGMDSFKAFIISYREPTGWVITGSKYIYISTIRIDNFESFMKRFKNYVTKYQPDEFKNL